MYKNESCSPCNSKFFRQDMCTWWRRERYTAVHPPAFRFPGQITDHFPAPYPIGLWNDWSFNMGMNKMESTVFPSFESNCKFYNSSRRNDKTHVPKMDKTSEKGFQLPDQVASQNSKQVHSAYLDQHGRFSMSHVLQQQSQFSPRQIQPPNPASQESRQIKPSIQKFYGKSYKNPPTNSNSNSSRNQVCRFCLQNGEDADFYTDHVLKDHNGKVTCPILRRHVCEICGATGDLAHTKAYCPLFKVRNKKPLAVLLKQTCHDSSGRIRK